MKQTRRHSGIPAILWATVCACATETSRDPAVLRVDSAGVEIVTNRHGATPSVYATVESAPVVEVGVVEGDSAHQLFMVMDAKRLADGRLIILNGGTRDFRVFDLNGDHMYSFGGPGDGPGEFGFVYRFQVSNDTLTTMDIQRWSFNWFRLDGTFLGSRRIDRTPYRAETIHAVPGGRALTYLWGDYDPSPGLRRADVALALIDSTGTSADTLGWYGSLENYVIRTEERLRPNSRPFGRDLYYSVGHEHLYVGDSERFEVQVFDLEGTLQRLVRFDGPVAALTAQDREAYEARSRDWVVANRPTDETYINRYFAEVPWPETRPAFGGFIEDRLGNLWVQRYVTPWETDRVYEVFDQEGQWVGEVAISGGLEPLDIARDYIVAKRRDEFEVEFVGVYELSRP